MASYKTDALVLKKRKLGEADNVLILASPSEGRIDAIARGVRKTSSRFGGRLEPFSYVSLILTKGRTFDTVSSVETVDSHGRLRGDLDRTSYAAVVVDVLDKILVRGQAEPRLVALADATLTAMETDGADLAALILGFSLKAMAMLGLRPSLEECLGCGAPLVGEAHFTFEGGGAVCTACRPDTPDAAPMSDAARRTMAGLLSKTMAEVAAMTLPHPAQAELFGLVGAFLASHVHGRLRSWEFLARLRTGQLG